MRRIVNRMLCARCSGLPLGKCWDFLSDMAFLWKSQHCAPFAHVCPWSKFRMFWLRRFPKTSPKTKHDQIVPCYHDHLRPFPYLSMASLMVAWARNWRLGWKVYVARVPEMGFPEFFLFSWGNDWWPAMASMGFGVPYFRPICWLPLIGDAWLQTLYLIFCGPLEIMTMAMDSVKGYSDSGNWFPHAHFSPIQSSLIQSVLISWCFKVSFQLLESNVRISTGTRTYMFWCLNVCIHLTCACGKHVTSSKSTRLAYSLTSHVSSLFRRSLLCHQERLYGVAQNDFQDIPEFQAGCAQVTQSAKSKANPKKRWADINEMWSHPLQLTTKTFSALHQTPRLNEGSSQSSIPCCLRPSIPIQRWDGSQRDQPSDVQRSADFSNTKNTQLRTSRNLLYPPAIHAIHAIYGLCPTVLFQVALVTQ